MQRFFDCGWRLRPGMTGSPACLNEAQAYIL